VPQVRRCVDCRGDVGEGVLSVAGTTAGVGVGASRPPGNVADGTSGPTGAFPRVAGTVHAERVPLPEIAAAAGTPAYVYSTGAIAGQYRALDAAFAAVPHRIHYSVKANGNLAILRLLQSLGAGVDIVSGGELFRALRANFTGRDVVFSGVGKTAVEIGEALAAGVRLINAESEAELQIVNDEAARAGVVADVALRVNPEVTVSTPHPYIKTGERGNKFGIAYDEIREVARRATRLPSIRISGLDMHLGSQIGGTGPYREGLQRVTELFGALVADGNTHLEYLDVGGGLAVTYDDERAADPVALAAVVTPAVPAGVTLVLEPGRYLVANAGVLLTRVLYRKQTGGKTYIITDAGMTELLRPSHYSAYHRIEPVVARPGGSTVVDVVGPVCESGDFFALDRRLDDVVPGDLLVIYSAGAYGFAMASNYNARPRPAEVLVDGGRFAVVTTRETYEDLVRHEQPTLAWRGA
jgi:diaminopimelate decarboxylase